ncbi:MAG: Osmosensitive channel histidine kinase KdpD [Myxococcaceae bacterium]|nr:Osmosensitive channel histidine kinase KdpD [Myxococcaceae bacterium]
MRLFTRLLISHWIPPLILTLALGLALTALLRVGVVLSTLNETELETLRDEGALHRAAWGLDVELRHAVISCKRGDPPSEIRRAVSSRAGALRSVFHEAPRLPAPMREVVSAYLRVASEALSGDACAALHEGPMRTRVAQLDERLTDLWVERLGELHRAVNTKENAARQIAVRAAWMGIPLAIASFVLAMWMARQMAQVLEQPLVKLAQAAQRVGRGDFATPASVIDGPPEILALAADLERMRQELQQLETLKQGFLASVSHELRTPLSKIKEGLALLADGALGTLAERQLRVVQIARSACEREIRLVTTLLDLSRLRAGSPIRMRESTSIDGVVNAAVDGERLEAQQRGVSIDLATRGDSGTGRLDPALMERAIANVVRNAVAVSTRGQTVSVERTVESEIGARHERVVRIVVRDHGPGVPAEIRSKLFDAFVTRPVPNSSKADGSGIGLALAREVARAHGGDLSLRDASSAHHGQGAIFELWVPLEGKAKQAELAPRSLGLDSSL